MHLYVCNYSQKATYMTLAYLIVGLLSEKPMSGYELNREFQAKVGHFWTTTQSQIYRTLHKLLDKGWVRVEQVVQEDYPDKKVYHITEKGRQALRQWTQMPLEEFSHPVREAWLGQLFFSGKSDHDEVIGLLHGYLERVQQDITALQGVEAHFFSMLDPATLPLQYRTQYLTLEYGIKINQAVATWLEQSIADLQTQQAHHKDDTPSTDAPDKDQQES